MQTPNFEATITPAAHEDHTYMHPPPLEQPPVVPVPHAPVPPADHTYLPKVSMDESSDAIFTSSSESDNSFGLYSTTS